MSQKQAGSVATSAIELRNYRVESLSLSPFDFDPFFNIIVDHRPMLRWKLGVVGHPGRLPLVGSTYLPESDRCPESEQHQRAAIARTAESIRGAIETTSGYEAFNEAARRDLVMELAIEMVRFWLSPRNLEARVRASGEAVLRGEKPTDWSQPGD